MKINKSTLDFVWEIAQKPDITIAGENGIANLSNSSKKISITLHLNGKYNQTAFYFLEIGRNSSIKDSNRLIGFMYNDTAPKEFINHATKKGEEVFWLSKNDLCLSLIDLMNFIKG